MTSSFQQKDSEGMSLREGLKEIMRGAKECQGVGHYGSILLTEECIDEVIDAFLHLVAEWVERMPELTVEELVEALNWKPTNVGRECARAERTNIVRLLKEG